MLLEALKFLPKSYLSYITGWFAHIPLPYPLNETLNRWFVNKYKIDMDVATGTTASYSCIGKLFTRDLKPGARPVGREPVSPVDGTIRNAAVVKSDYLEQVKGKQYSLDALLGDTIEAKRFSHGIFFNLYLAPTDYHHIHSPVTGHVRKRVHIPGALWPVNDWSLHTVNDLFAINERVVVYLSTPQGEVAVVLVGATNVGRISLSFEDLVTNSAPWQTKATSIRLFSNDRPELTAGQRLGTFHLGSTVLVFFDENYTGSKNIDTGRLGTHILYGETLSL